MRWQNIETPTFAGSAGSAGEPAVVETMQLLDRDGNEVAAFTKAVDGTIASTVDGQPKVYRALLSQTGTDAPVATVLENTLGADVTYAYDDAGIYRVTLSLPILTAGKTCLPPLNASRAMDGDTIFTVTSFYYVDTIRLAVQTAIADIAAGTLTLTDGLLANSYVEILVYP